MTSYKIEKNSVFVQATAATLLKIGFADPATNDQIVRDVESLLVEMETSNLGGELVLVNGPASLPVAVVLGHHLIHRFGAVGVFDPKLQAYVVATSHGDNWRIGDLIPATEVAEE